MTAHTHLRFTPHEPVTHPRFRRLNRRVFEFTNGGDFDYYIGSADWMRRNLDRRVETITPVLDNEARKQLSQILDVYDNDNCSARDCGPFPTVPKR